MTKAKAKKKKASSPKRALVKEPPRVSGPHSAEPKGLYPCHFCKKDVKAEDMFCFGCRYVICDECDKGMGGMGHGHSPDMHREEPEEFEW